MDDPVPHGAALNMAIDESLLAALPGPLLRVYRWERPAVSFGYFERWTPVRDAFPDRDAVRRWTGGGVVPHGGNEDFTYSLLLPGGCVEGAARTYAAIHGALCAGLREAGIDARMAGEAGEKVSQSCFENPVRHDVLAGGTKIAGAAQRRTRAGLLHQGSVQGVALPPDFGARFAARLAAAVRPFAPDLPPEAMDLAARKYASRSWLERRQ